MLGQNIYLYQEKRESQNKEKKLENSSFFKNYRILKQIGSGSFAKVFKIQEKTTGEYFALKKIRKSKIQHNRKEHLIYIEKLVLQTLKDSHIVDLKMTFQDSKNIYFLLEYISKKNLSDFIQDQKVDDNQVKFYIAEIINIIENLQKNGIVHRDLKPENFMLDSSNHLKLIDFGTASIFKLKNKNNNLYKLYKDVSKRFKKKYLQTVSFCFQEDLKNEDKENWRLKETVGTSYYISPECINCLNDISGCDFWSLGIILYKMLTGCYPFTGQNEQEIFEKILKGQFFMPPYLSESAKDLISKLLKVNPEQRLGNGKIHNTLEDLKNHSFFQEMNFNEIYEVDPLLALKNKKNMLQEDISRPNNIDLNDQVLLSTTIKYRSFFLFWNIREIVLSKDGKLMINKNGIKEKEIIIINQNIRINSFKKRIIIGTSIFNSFDLNLKNKDFQIWSENLKSFL